MNRQSHEQIQRFVAGKASIEEASALEQELKIHPELRSLYLDYVNLDVALASAAARRAAEIPSAPAQAARRLHWWLVAAAAMILGLLAFVLLPRPRGTVVTRADLALSVTSTQAAIDRLSATSTSPGDWWKSPTDSLLPATRPALRSERIP